VSKEYNLKSFMKKVVLVICDGWGVAPPSEGNAPMQANLTFLRSIEKYYPFTILHASGINVGLPWWEEGNSEVGHLTIGSGKVIYHYLPRIILSIQDGSFFQNPALLRAINHAKKNKSKLHLMGLVSSGGVHSYIDHFYGLLDLCQKEKVEKVYLHFFTDGRDTLPKEAKTFLPMLLQRIRAQEVGTLATLHGRCYSMDRDRNWDRTEKSYRCLVFGEGAQAPDPIKYIEECYQKGLTDEFIPPAVVDPKGIIESNDAIIFFNFREDRARQLTMAFLDENFNHFERKKLQNIHFTGMTRYLDLKNLDVAFEPPEIGLTLGEILSQNNLLQWRIAETEKYAHVTYFFNGLREEPFKGEERKLIPSRGGPHYDKSPEMQARAITEEALSKIKLKKYHFILINFANPDMVGHTGNLKAAIKAAEVLDECFSKIVPLALESEYVVLITADHGNFEEMLDPRTGEVLTEHSSNPVPFYLVDPEMKKTLPSKIEIFQLKKAGGFLFDIAPTVLDYLEIPKPNEMPGVSLKKILSV
jgi:2,3-bisphosphoglycerate-independent phosphoglycerate mutase